MRGTRSDGTGEGVSQAAEADTDTAREVEPTGHFRIYLGAAPGVGKTYAMLSEGQRRRGRGTDVVAGFVEAYGRPLTEALINGLEVIPRKVVDYRGTRLEEMDLDAVLRRRPEVALVDELAHTNVPGSGRHGKRWQDVLDILGAGINVITTVNIQHLESIADEVEQMTGARVRRTGTGLGGAQGQPDRADRLLTGAAAPPDAARQHLPEAKGPPGPDSLLPYRQPDRLAGAGAAVRGRRVR